MNNNDIVASHILSDIEDSAKTNNPTNSDVKLNISSLLNYNPY